MHGEGGQTIPGQVHRFHVRRLGKQAGWQSFQIVSGQVDLVQFEEADEGAVVEGAQLVVGEVQEGQVVELLEASGLDDGDFVPAQMQMREGLVMGDGGLHGADGVRRQVQLCKGRRKILGNDSDRVFSGTDGECREIVIRTALAVGWTGGDGTRPPEEEHENGGHGNQIHLVVVVGIDFISITSHSEWG